MNWRFICASFVSNRLVMRMVFKKMQAVLSVINRVQGILQTFLLIVVTLLVFVQVILRYVNMPLMGIEELLSLPTIWLYMIASATASLERNHIECGIATLYIKTPKALCVFKTIRNTLSVLIGGWLLRWAFWYLSYTFRVGKTTALLMIPMKYIESAIFVGFLLMFAYALLELFENMRDLWSGDFSSYASEVGEGA